MRTAAPDVDRDSLNGESVDERAPDAQQSSRRSFIFFGALAAAAMVPGAASAQSPRRPRKPQRPVADPFNAVLPNEAVAAEQDATPLGRLLRRATMGITPAEVSRAKTMGYQGWLNYQLNYTRIDNGAIDAYVALAWP